jgi:hypothetical protein
VEVDIVTDAKTSYSNWGTCVDINTAGTYVRAVFKGNPTAFAYLDGTPITTLRVSGAAALLWAKNTKRSNNDVEKDLINLSTKNTI